MQIANTKSSVDPETSCGSSGRLASSVEHLDVGIRTGWTSDRARL